jgi:thiamine kinase-like enzyme
MKNDWSLDDLDCLVILAIGDKGNKSTKIHKMVIILSKLLNIQMDTEAYQGYSETVAERLNSRSETQFFVKIDNKYKLTEQGKELYYELLEQLRAKNRDDVVALLNALSRMSNKNLLALTYFLYPETTEKSTTEDDINKIIQSLKEKGKKNFKVKREGSNNRDPRKLLRLTDAVSGTKR